MSTLIKKLGSMDETMRDLVDQLNRALKERDDRIAHLEALPEAFAFAAVTTDGVGGVTTDFAFGCRAELAGGSLRLRFTTRRKTTNYVQGMMAVNAARLVEAPSLGSASHSVDFADFRMRAAGGGLLSFATTAGTVVAWCQGPR